MKHIRFMIFAIVFTLFSPTLAAADEKDMASFQTVWETVKKQHWDLPGTGVDWDEVYQRYKPKVEAAETRSEVRQHLSAMLKELGQSHFNILEESAHQAMEAITAKFPTGTGWPGFEVAVVEGKVFVVEIDKSSDAAKQGVVIGTQMLALRGEELQPVVKGMKDALSGAAHEERDLKEQINRFFSGFPGEFLPVKILRDGKAQEIEIELVEPKGRFMQLLNIPRVYFHYESRIMGQNIGYVAFNVFLFDAKQAFEKDILGEMAATDGLIIDLRGNPGGMGMLSSAFAGRIIEEKGKKLGVMHNSGGTLNFPIFPQNPVYTKPVAILIDAGSASTSEIMAQGLKDLKRAKLFGSRSAGAALPSFIETLPNGDLFQYAIGDFVSVGGKTIEGVGVEPDVFAPHTLESLGRGEDAALAAARAWILSIKTGAQNESL